MKSSLTRIGLALWAAAVFVILSRAFAGAVRDLVLYSMTEASVNTDAARFGHAAASVALLCGLLGYGLRGLEPPR